MSAQHTPGPWEADLTSVHADNGIIADLYLDDATGEANARLIAAAPDLLAFAEAYRVDLQERGIHEADMDECAMELLSMADTAIAKARGEA